MKNFRHCAAYVLWIAIPWVVSAEIPGSLKSLAWKEIAKEVSDDAPFRAGVRKILTGLEPDKKAAVNKCIAQIIAGNGVIITGTPVDDLLAKALRAKGKEFAVGDSLQEFDQLSNVDLLKLASGGAAISDPTGAGNPQNSDGTGKVILVSDPTKCLDASHEGRVNSSKTGTLLRIVTGLSDPNGASLESIQSPGSYLRHNNSKIWLKERPTDAEERRIFDIAATFKIVKLKGANIRFQAAGRPGQFIKVEKDGEFVLGTITTGELATFRFETK